MKGKFDVAAKAAELIPSAVVVEDQELKVNRSGDAMEKVMTLDTGNEGDDDRTQAKTAVTVLYQSLSYLLQDTDGNNPDPDWLKGKIDFEVASVLLGELMPGGPEGPPTETAPETPSSPDSGESP